VGILHASVIEAHTSAEDIGGAYLGLGLIRAAIDWADLEDARALLESTAG
jgi:hypothetical protein